MKKSLCLSILLLAAQAYASDVRSVAELQLMNNAELAEAARWACVSAVTQGPLSPERYKQTRYLSTIGLVARQKNNGKFPDWYTKIELASPGGNIDACLNAYNESKEGLAKENLTDSKGKRNKK